MVKHVVLIITTGESCNIIHHQSKKILFYSKVVKHVALIITTKHNFSIWMKLQFDLSLAQLSHSLFLSSFWYNVGTVPLRSVLNVGTYPINQIGSINSLLWDKVLRRVDSFPLVHVRIIKSSLKRIVGRAWIRNLIIQGAPFHGMLVVVCKPILVISLDQSRFRDFL